MFSYFHWLDLSINERETEGAKVLEHVGRDVNWETYDFDLTEFEDPALQALFEKDSEIDSGREAISDKLGARQDNLAETIADALGLDCETS